MQNHHEYDQTRPWRHLVSWPLVIFLTGLVITVSLFFSIYSAEREATIRDFEYVAQDRLGALRKEFAELNSSALAVESYMGLVPADRNRAHGFSDFVRHALSNERHIRAVAWVLTSSADLHDATEYGTQTLAAEACDFQGMSTASQVFRMCVLMPFGNGGTLLAEGLATNPELVTALTRASQTDEGLVISGSPAGAEGLTGEQVQHRFFVYPLRQDHDSDRGVKDTAGAKQGFLVYRGLHSCHDRNVA